MMTVPMQTLEARILGAAPEFEWGEYEGEAEYLGEHEYEYEAEHEGEYESEEFFRGLASLAARAARNPTLRRIGLSAARQAISAIPKVAGSIGTPGSVWSKVGSSAGGALSRHLLSRLPASEFEGEWESDGEYEINPIAKVYPAALMEHLGRAAAEAEDEAQAEACVGGLVPLAARIAPRATPTIMRATPQLIQGTANVTRLLRSSPSTTPLVRAVPLIVQRTAKTLGNQASAGRPPSAAQAVRALANQTARTLTSPRQCVQAYQRSNALDRRYHKALGR